MSERYGYFVVHARTVAHRESVGVAGIVEDLSTSTKRVFASEDELAALMRQWASEPIQINRARTEEAP